MFQLSYDEIHVKKKINWIVYIVDIRYSKKCNHNDKDSLSIMFTTFLCQFICNTIVMA